MLLVLIRFVVRYIAEVHVLIVVADSCASAFIETAQGWLFDFRRRHPVPSDDPASREGEREQDRHGPVGGCLVRRVRQEVEAGCCTSNA